MKDPETELVNFLNKIIDENIENFKEQGDFIVRPGIAYDRFDLTAVDGSYDMSLAGLVHHFLYERGHYEKILPKNEFEECENVVKNYPESIYGPEDDEDIQLTIDELHHVARQTVGNKLKNLKFKISDEFEELLD